LPTGNIVGVLGGGWINFCFPEGGESAETRITGFAFRSGTWLMVPTTISAAMSAASALLTNTRIAIVDESIFQNERQQYYARRQENGCSPNMNKLDGFLKERRFTNRRRFGSAVCKPQLLGLQRRNIEGFFGTAHNLISPLITSPSRPMATS